jgi:hypothetical protein
MLIIEVLMYKSIFIIKEIKSPFCHTCFVCYMNDFQINLVRMTLQLWFALYVATNSGEWFGTAVLVTNMRNFPLSRGTISGILKGYIGISASVYALIYSILLKASASKLLLFLAIGVSIVFNFDVLH